MDRKTITVDEPVYDQLVEHKRDDESWTEFEKRLVNALKSADDELAECSLDGVAATKVDEIARAVGDEVESRLTRR